MTETGIALSHHETVDDWEAARGEGAVFACITTSESMNWRDPDAAKQVTAAQEAGLHTGVRHFARPGGPEEQARLAARVAGPLGAFHPGSLAPALHVAVAGIDDRFVKTWVRTIRNVAHIRRVQVYATLEHWSHHLQPDKWADDEMVLGLLRHNGIAGRPGWSHARLGMHQHQTGRAAVVYPFTLADVLL